MASSSTSRVVIYALLGGFFGALVMGLIAYMMLVPTPMGSAPFFVAAAMIMGMGSTSWIAGWMLHLVTGLVVGAIFGVAVAKVSGLRLKTAGRALTLGTIAGIAVWVVFFIPMMAMLMPALMGMGMMVAGSFVAHVVFGLVLGGVTSLAIPKGGPSYKCPTCGATFGTQDELMQHGKKHMSSTPQEFKCPACGATFASQKELMDHKTKAHPM
ncbi:MAG: C2H2-type zinc finger protein [Thaumarchaeota archaeon]|nr:C2H2-type zinc finger protein [Nitrososphaerota archaeon]